MPRFVILEHDHPTLHWDLMLEYEGVLKTWRLAKPPPERGRESAGSAPLAHEITPLPHHRLMYLDYEGPVSGDRGQVKRWDAGTYELLEQHAGAWRVRLAGARFEAILRLPVMEES